MTASDKPKPAIDVRDLTKHYQSSHANQVVLENLSVTVPQGHVACFLGHNGAGKTTLVKILSTLIGFDEGTVLVMGHDVRTNAREVRRRISTTGQFAAIDEQLTGRENLIFFGRLKGLPLRRARDRANDLLAQFDLVDAAGKRVAEYSGGMRRRLDIAVSLCVIPDILFLDEPSTGLDPASREKLWDSIRALRGEGLTVVLTTQYLEEAQALADDIHFLRGRHIVASGTAEELRRHAGVDVATVQFADAEDARQFADSLAAESGWEPVLKGAEVSCDVGSVSSAMATLEAARERSGIDMVEISIAPPSLNDVFMRLNPERKG